MWPRIFRRRAPPPFHASPHRTVADRRQPGLEQRGADSGSRGPPRTGPKTSPCSCSQFGYIRQRRVTPAPAVGTVPALLLVAMSDQLLRPNSPSVVSEIIDGEAVIMNLATGHYFSALGTGGELWALIEKGA